MYTYLTTKGVCAKEIGASTINLSQLTIKIKIIYLCLVGGERSGPGSNAIASSSTCFYTLYEIE
jgi:hypothetical protein